MKYKKIIAVALAVLAFGAACVLAAVRPIRQREQASRSGEPTAEETTAAPASQEERTTRSDGDTAETDIESGNGLFLNVDQTNEHPREASPHIEGEVVIIEGIKEKNS